MSKRIGPGWIVAALTIAALLLGVFVAPRLEIVFGGAHGVHDAAALPGHIGVCGRSWSKDALERKLSLAEIRGRDGIDPDVVDPGPFAPCPTGPCTPVAQDVPCHTVIYVRVGEDAYLDYAVQGGP